jgi:uncharacterized membrane protein (UPF0127 family)
MTQNGRAVVPVLALALGLASACAGGGAWSAPPSGSAGEPSSRQIEAAARAFADARRAEVRFPGGRVIAAEIADTPERIMYGYMFRPEVGEEDGMVFVFPEPGVHNFWMKNTLVPLDMIWMDGDRTILHIRAAAPPCRVDPCPSYGPMRAVSYVLEVRAGTAAREGLKRGDRLAIVFPGEPGRAR